MAKNGELKVIAAERDEALIFKPRRGRVASIIDTYAMKGDTGSSKRRERKGIDIVALWTRRNKSTNKVDPVMVPRKILTILLDITRGCSYTLASRMA